MKQKYWSPKTLHTENWKAYHQPKGIRHQTYELVITVLWEAKAGREGKITKTIIFFVRKQGPKPMILKCSKWLLITVLPNWNIKSKSIHLSAWTYYKLVCFHFLLILNYLFVLQGCHPRFSAIFAIQLIHNRLFTSTYKGEKKRKKYKNHDCF